MSNRVLAIVYAASGVRVFPCNPDTKAPLTSNGFHDGTTDTAVVKEWWSQHPNALIGGVCGELFDVIDIDLYKGEKALASLGYLVANGLVDFRYQAITKSGGHHYYVKASGHPRRIGILDSVDYCGKGGYVILPDDDAYRTKQKAFEFSFLFNELPEITPVLRTLLERKECEAKEKTRRISLDSADKRVLDEAAKHTIPTDFRKSATEYKKFSGDLGDIDFSPNSIDSDTVNRLFYNREIQVNLANFLGVRTPSKGKSKSTAFRSLIPGHADLRPSMGSRWSQDGEGDHLLIRDFSNYYKKSSNADYNIVSLYATTCYATNKMKLNKPEFFVWFMRMLWETGYIDLKIPKLKGNYTKNEQTFLESFYLLKKLRGMYKGDRGECLFSAKFAGAWSGLGKITAYRIRESLVKEGVLAHKGDHGEGYYKTGIYDISDDIFEEEKEMKPNEEKPELNFPVETVVGYGIDDGFKEKLFNFCQDFDIPNVVPDDLMVVVVGVLSGDIELKSDVNVRAINMNNFYLFVEDLGSPSLMVQFDSDEFDAIAQKIMDEYDPEFEYDNTFVLSTDIGDTDIDVEELSFKMNEYFPYITASRNITGKYTEGEVDSFMLGVRNDV